MRKKQSVKKTSGAHQNQKTLKEMQEKEHPFLDSNVAEIFDELLKHKLIELPKMKRPNKAGRTNNPNYCNYYKLLSHPMEKCFIFKNKFIQLANEKKIFLMMRRPVLIKYLSLLARLIQSKYVLKNIMKNY